AQNFFAESGHHFALADGFLVGAGAALKTYRPKRVGVGSSKQIFGENFKPAIARAPDHPMPYRSELGVKAARKFHRGRAEVFDSVRPVQVAGAAVDGGDR